MSLRAQSPEEVARKLCDRYIRESNFELTTQPLDPIQKGILVMYPSGGTSFELETILTISDLGGSSVAFAASPGELKVWQDFDKVFDGTTSTRVTPKELGTDKFESEFSVLLPPFPGDYPFRIHYTPTEGNGAIFIWPIDENGLVRKEISFRSDWDFSENYTYRFTTDLTDELNKDWIYPEEVEGLQHKSPQGMNGWQYHTGITLDAMWKLSSHFENLDYTDFIKKHLDFFVESIEKVKESSNQQPVLDVPLAGYFRYSQLDDFGPQTLPFMRFPNEESYKSFVSKARTRILYKTTRLQDGTFARLSPDSLTIWAEDLYMGVVLLSELYQSTNSAKYLDLAIQQAILFDKKLTDRRSGLYWHGYNDSLKEPVGSLFGLANGWALLAKMELLRTLPQNHRDGKGVMQLFREHAAVIREFQSVNGRWNSLPETEESELETSSTAMFITAFAEGVVNNWLDNKEDYRRSAISGWLALLEQIDEEGNLSGVVVEAPILESDEAYKNLSLQKNGPHGLGVMLQACMAIDRLNDQE